MKFYNNVVIEVIKESLFIKPKEVKKVMLANNSDNDY